MEPGIARKQEAAFVTSRSDTTTCPVAPWTSSTFLHQKFQARVCYATSGDFPYFLHPVSLYPPKCWGADDFNHGFASGRCVPSADTKQHAA